MNGIELTSINEENKTRLEDLLAGITTGKRTLNYNRNQIIFSQGDPADAVFLILQGQVKLTVVSFAGKEATLSVLGPQEFFGVGALGQQRQRLGTASALESSVLIRVEKNVMLLALRNQPELFNFFLASVLNRTVTLQKDLCTQILDPSEKILMHVLLKLSQSGEERQGRIKLPQLSHEILATMVGTTRSRVTFFINKFRKLGLIDAGKGLFVHPSRLNAALQEDHS